MLRFWTVLLDEKSLSELRALPGNTLRRHVLHTRRTVLVAHFGCKHYNITLLFVFLHFQEPPQERYFYCFTQLKIEKGLE